jgi:N-acylneuraminate cytidylyltransferase
VIVSTDSEKIAEVAKEHGAEVLMRPPQLALDNSPELLSWKHAINSFQHELNSLFVSLPATSPLRAPEDVNNAISKFISSKYDVLFGISPSQRNPYLNMVKVNDEDCLEIIVTGSQAVRRQDVPDVFDVTTSVYVAHADYILETDKIMAGKVGYVLIPPERSLDIDTEYDLYLSDLILSHPFKGKR